MSGAKRGHPRKHPAHQLCRCFEGSRLATFARPGLEVLEAEHKDTISGGAGVACGVPLDRAWKDVDDQIERWDYVFTMRAAGPARSAAATAKPAAVAARSVEAVAVEVHHATAEEVPKMIAKKRQADALLAAEAPAISVQAWVWIASPPAGEVFLLRQSPSARLLAEAGIEFPRARLALP